MKTFARTFVLSLSTAAVVLSAMPIAEAGDRHRRHRVERHHDRVGEAIGAGIIGLARGAIVVGVLSEQANANNNAAAQNPYRRPRPSPERDFFPAPPPRNYGYEASYSRSLEPWSPGWYDYCEARYRSFRADTGTYTTYSGEKRFCVAD
ncbi:MAG: BA14K family protein [Rhizobiaceae bacterium]|nr:BA14K family protein [Rhizobiaceae bacterium]